jgi:23S rRNA pseudouridine2605 synthase
MKPRKNRLSSTDAAALPFVDPEEAPADLAAPPEPTLVRLNKYLADRGIASRRKCDELIAGGQVTVDGELTTELGTKIDPEKQSVEIDGYVLKPGGMRRRYYLLNKPAGVVCTNEPRETRPRAVDLITDARKGRIYTVGRLDEESKGLILLTNDGDFANRIMHPRYGVEKTYVVRVAGKIDDAALQKIRDGVHLAEGRTAGARVLVDKRLRDQSTLTLTLREGMNREIRRAFAAVGFKVLDLRRTRIGPLSERGMKIGRWRELTNEEGEALRAGRNLAIEHDTRRRGGSRGYRPSDERGRRTHEPNRERRHHGERERRHDGGSPRGARPFVGKKPAFGKKTAFGKRPAFDKRPRFDTKAALDARPAFAMRRAFAKRAAFDKGPAFAKKPAFGDKRGKPRHGKGEHRR